MDKQKLRSIYSNAVNAYDEANEAFWDFWDYHGDDIKAGLCFLAFAGGLFYIGENGINSHIAEEIAAEEEREKIDRFLQYAKEQNLDISVCEGVTHLQPTTD